MAKFAIEGLTRIDTDRQELVSWLNNLLQLNITKVEQCGTGYVAPCFYPSPA